MADYLLRVFVSATSFDLEESRLVARDELLEQRIFPVVQNHFPPDYRDLVEYLRDQVAACDAVLCLVGDLFGAAPAAGETRRSYTQIEYDVARELDKPVFVFLASPEYRPKRTRDEPPENVAEQRRHREALLRSHKCEFVASPDEVRRKLLKIVPTLHRMAGRSSILYLHPPAPPAFFAGRTREMRQLAADLRARTPSAIAVVGMGGQGKTALARRTIAERTDLPFAGGFWCSAERGGFGFDDFLDATLAHFTSGLFDKRAAPDAETRIAALVAELQTRPLLVVIDSLERWLRGWNRDDGYREDDFGDRRGRFEGLDRFLESALGLSNGSHVLVTTRALPACWEGKAAVVPIRDPGASLGLDGLETEDAVALLRSLGVHGDETALREVAERYACHPLALEALAGLLVQREGGDVRRAPQRSPLDPKRRLFELFEAMRRCLPGRRRAERMLRIASHFADDPTLAEIAEATRRDSAAWRVAGLLPKVAREAARRAIATTNRDVERLESTAATLHQWNLATWNGVREPFKLHPLVKEFFLDRGRRRRSLDRALRQAYLARPTPRRPITLEDARPRRLAIEHALLGGDGDAAFASLFGSFAEEPSFVEWLSRCGHQECGAELLLRAADAARPIDRLRALGAAGALLWEVGRLDKALEALDQAVEESNASAKFSQVEAIRLRAAFLQNRGNVLRTCRRHAEAERDLDAAVEALRTIANRSSEACDALAKALVNRGNLIRDRGELTRALRDYDEGAASLEACGDRAASVAGTASARLCRAICFADLWDGERASAEFDRCLSLYDRLIDAEGPRWEANRAYAEAMYGSMLAMAGRSDEAVARTNAGVGRLRDLVNADRRDLEERLALALIAAAQARIEAGDWSAAEADARSAIAIFRDLGGPALRLDGDLGHAGALLSEALVGLERIDEARGVRDEAFARLNRTIDSGVFDNVAVYLRKAVSGATLLFELKVDADAAFGMLERAFAFSDRELARRPPIESALREICRSMRRLEERLPPDVLESCRERLAFLRQRTVAELTPFERPSPPLNP